MRSPADSGCATCRRSTGPTQAAAADPGRRQVPRLQCARVLDAVRALRIHVEPTPCEREPASGLGEPVRWSARHPPGLSRFTRTRPSRRSRSMVGGASAPPTLFREYPGRVLELLGDSARGDDWAVARLRVDGDRIVDADVEGLDAD